jgi:hypothetical protein
MIFSHVLYQLSYLGTSDAQSTPNYNTGDSLDAKSVSFR